jgi:hypothetical protein
MLSLAVGRFACGSKVLSFYFFQILPAGQNLEERMIKVPL